MLGRLRAHFICLTLCFFFSSHRAPASIGPLDDKYTKLAYRLAPDGVADLTVHFDRPATPSEGLKSRKLHSLNRNESHFRV